MTKNRKNKQKTNSKTQINFLELNFNHSLYKNLIFQISHIITF